MEVLFLTGSGVDYDAAARLKDRLIMLMTEKMRVPVDVKTGWEMGNEQGRILDFDTWMSGLVRQNNRFGRRRWKYIVVQAGFIGNVTFKALDEYIAGHPNQKAAGVLVYDPGSGTVETTGRPVLVSHTHKSNTGFFASAAHFERTALNEEDGYVRYLDMRTDGKYLPDMTSPPATRLLAFLKRALNPGRRRVTRPAYL